jgi:DNA-binding MarR family transcriptional regulator
MWPPDVGVSMSQLADTTRPTAVDPLPDDLASASAKLVFLYLDRAGPTTISELSTDLDMRKLSLYAVLDSLAGKGLVDSEGETYAAV